MRSRVRSPWEVWTVVALGFCGLGFGAGCSGVQPKVNLDDEATDGAGTSTESSGDASGQPAVGSGQTSPEHGPSGTNSGVTTSPPNGEPPEIPESLRDHHPNLLQPATLKEEAPETFDVKFDTTRGDFVVRVHRKWAAEGADRFYNLVRVGYYDNVAFFRVLKGFVVQFGIHGEPVVNAAWREATIEDDPVVESNKRGYVSFAKSSTPASRTTQVFVNLANTNAFLDRDGFAPFGEVVDGMDVVDALYSGYEDGPPRGSGPEQSKIQSQGNAYLESQFPELDYVRRAVVLP